MDIAIINSNKAITSAITSTFENNTKAVVVLMKNKIVLPSKIEKELLFEKVMFLLSTNKSFANDYMKLMYAKGEFRNADYTYRNMAISAIAGAVSALSGVASSYMSSKDAPERREHEIAVMQNNLILEAKKSEEENKKRKQTIIIVSIISIVSIIGLVIFKMK